MKMKCSNANPTNTVELDFNKYAIYKRQSSAMKRGNKRTCPPKESADDNSGRMVASGSEKVSFKAKY